MKLQLALIAALSEAKGPKKDESKPKSSGPPMVHCSDQIGPEDYQEDGYNYASGEIYWDYDVDYVATEVSSISLDQGQFGTVSFNNYTNNLYCYIDFAHECDGSGVDIEFTKMTVQTRNHMNYWEKSRLYLRLSQINVHRRRWQHAVYGKGLRQH